MADVREREKIVREIEKTSESIRKKHRALKTGRIEEGIALDRHFKPVIEPLRLFADNPGERATKRELRDEDAASAPKRERKEEEQRREKKRARRSNLPQLCINTVIDRANRCKRRKVERRYEPTWVRWVKSTSRGAHNKESGIDHVYGVYLHKDGLMFGNKRFDVDDADNTYQSDIRRIFVLLSNRGYKYKYIIAPLMLVTPKKQSKKSEKRLPHAMTLNDNAIDYVHWDDPNELVDPLRLLDASHRAFLPYKNHIGWF
ncbi:hypothetical protein ALC57_01224 [Trachymyrmex cornetzi]|uniref:Uncharacterized protein n=1 Tax=Trachymyrmex cornetzi TaxID=471704 RepID=A0A151JQJ7_9HYME|nr:hypothetical protein ALC57_01224 [Trachymyrmex cornetzi]